MKTEINSKITKKADINILNSDSDFIPTEVFVNWFFETLTGTGSVQVEVSIKSVFIYGIKDSTGEREEIIVDPLLCDTYIKETTLDSDIHPVICTFDFETKKCEISF